MKKWDLVEKDTNTVNEYKKDVATDLAFMDYVETVFVSAKTGQRAEKIIEYCERAVENANFQISKGEVIGFLGPNGAGKSTTLNAVAGVWPIDSGDILIDGVNVNKLCEHKRARLPLHLPL